MKKFIIVGGGISGLSNAFYLLKRFPRCAITLIEKSDRIGGAMKSTPMDGAVCEEGPRSIRNSKYCFQLFKMIDELGLSKDFIAGRYLPFVNIYHDGKLRKIPQKITFEGLLAFNKDHPGMAYHAGKLALKKLWLNNRLNSY
jgi:oxygen-dependent protoporphyrinogen oxidase